MGLEHNTYCLNTKVFDASSIAENEIDFATALKVVQQSNGAEEKCTRSHIRPQRAAKSEKFGAELGEPVRSFSLRPNATDGKIFILRTEKRELVCDLSCINANKSQSDATAPQVAQLREALNDLMGLKFIELNSAYKGADEFAEIINYGYYDVKIFSEKNPITDYRFENFYGMPFYIQSLEFNLVLAKAGKFDPKTKKIDHPDNQLWSKVGLKKEVGTKIVLDARRLFQTSVKSLPNGQLVDCRPWDGDEIGDRREQMFSSFGFGPKDEKNRSMCGIVYDGELLPITSGEMFMLAAELHKKE